MSNKVIRSLFEQRLAAWAAARPISVAWENVAFTPPSGQTYLKAHLLPAETDSLDLAGAHRQYLGSFQVSIVFPAGIGAGDAGTIEEALDDLFPVNLRLSQGDFTVQVVSPCSSLPMIKESSLYTIPVRLNYQADTI